MMHEEFMDLSGIKVSLRYYEETIEPEYANNDCADKQEFCAKWVKDNKSIICKASSTDIYELSQIACISSAIRSDARRDRDERAAAEKLVDELRKELEEVKYKYNEQLNYNDNLQGVLKNREDCYCQVQSLESELAAKDIEIIKLKAMLFDYMIKAA